MKRANLVNFTEIVEHATTLGYDWNNACELLDNLRPQYEVSSYEFEKSEFDKNKSDNEHSDEENEIMTSFFEKNKVKRITVVND